MNESLNVTPIVGRSYRLLKHILAASGRSLIDRNLIGNGPLSVSSMMSGSIFTVVNPPLCTLGALEGVGDEWMVEIMCGDSNYIVCLRTDCFEPIENDI